MISLISEKFASSLRCVMGNIRKSLHSWSMELPPNRMKRSGRQSTLEEEMRPS